MINDKINYDVIMKFKNFVILVLSGLLLSSCSEDVTSVIFSWKGFAGLVVIGLIVSWFCEVDEDNCW